MQLIAANEAESGDLRYLVRSVCASKIFYVWTGRNAWWSTWATQYSPGCFHSTLQSAKSYCERRRVQGTVFYIDEIPVLSFQAHERYLVAAEINTTQFLGELDKDRLLSIVDVLPIKSMTLTQIDLMLSAESPLWSYKNRWLNRMHMSFGSGPDSPISIDDEEQLLSYKSRAIGTDYLLRWESRPFNKDRSRVHAIAVAIKALKSR